MLADMGKSLEVRPAALLRQRAHDHSPYHGRVHRAPGLSRLTIALIAATIGGHAARVGEGTLAL